MARKRMSATFKVVTGSRLTVVGTPFTSTEWDRIKVTEASGLKKLPRRYTVQYKEDLRGPIRYSGSYCTLRKNPEIYWNACILADAGFKDGINVRRVIIPRLPKA